MQWNEKNQKLPAYRSSGCAADKICTDLISSQRVHIKGHLIHIKIYAELVDLATISSPIYSYIAAARNAFSDRVCACLTIFFADLKNLDPVHID